MKGRKEYRTFKLELSALDESTGHVEGYASVFNNAFPVWDQMETVSPGAFKKSLKENGGKVPVLFNHFSMEWIGNADSGKEDEHGLYVTADLLVNSVQRAREIYALAKDAMSKGMKVGLSIGFETMRDVWSTIEKVSMRDLKELALWEWSICQWPANPDAQLTDVRSLDGLAYTIASLTGAERDKLKALLTPVDTTLEAARIKPSPDIHDAEALAKFLTACIACRGK
jgi:HK97 family phage prohead protease